MFPFFIPKGAMGNVLVLDRRADPESTPDMDGLTELEAAMHPLMKAFESKDLKAMAQAFHDAFQIADASPHEEYQQEMED
jgi:hypothetical protein